MAKRNQQPTSPNQGEIEQPTAGDNPAPSLGLDAPAATIDQVPSYDGPGESQAEIEQPPAAIVRGQQGDEGRPYCPGHNVLMRAYGSKPNATHYKCPVDGCTETAKRARPQIKIPAEPQLCPQRTCRPKNVALKVNPKLSNLAQLQMECPGCGFNMKVPRPQFVQDKRRAAAEDLSER